jgi:hypothetical protein
MPKYNLAIGRFPYGGIERTECVDWLIRIAETVATDPRLDYCWLKENDTPITMTRNKMFADACNMGADFLLIVDSDMAPDIELQGRHKDPFARPFFESSLEFMLDHKGPCVVAAPYCGPPPHENVYIFQWGNKESGVPHERQQHSLDQFTREQAALMSGITQVGALPTGLMLIDCRVFKELPYPFTYYEYEGDGVECPQCKGRHAGPQAKKASTEDVTFTRDLTMLGIPVYCNWDAWAGHCKNKIVGKPRVSTVQTVAAKMREAVVRGVNSFESIREIKAHPRFAADIARAEAEFAARKLLDSIDPDAEQDVRVLDQLKPVADRIAAQLTAPEGSPKPVTMADLMP